MRTGSVALKIHNGCAEKAKKLNVSKGIALPSHLYFQFESQSCHINAKRRTCYQLGHYLTTTSQLQFESQSCHINTKEHDVANWATPIAQDQQKTNEGTKGVDGCGDCTREDRMARGSAGPLYPGKPPPTLCPWVSISLSHYPCIIPLLHDILTSETLERL